MIAVGDLTSCVGYIVSKGGQCWMQVGVVVRNYETSTWIFRYLVLEPKIYPVYELPSLNDPIADFCQPHLDNSS